MVQRIDAVAMRRTLGRFTTGVTVVTTASGGDVHAMTANAFTSVSLDPPLVLVSVDHRTRMHALLPDTRRYGVSSRGRVEDLHTRPGEPPAFPAGAFGRLSAEEQVLARSWGG